MHWDFSPIWQYHDVIIRGLGVTFLITILSSIAGLVIGIVIALLLSSRLKTVSVVTTVFTEFFRACPPLVLLLMTYYLLPTVTGVGVSSFNTALIVFSLYFAAFSGDILRSNIASIQPGAIRSYAALGLSRSQVVSRFIIPEILRRSFGALNALFISNLKMSSLASVIAVQELTYAGTLILAQRPRPFEIYIAMAAAYIAIIVPLVGLLRLVEQSRYFSYAPRSNY
jgi:polar amino acid transport system permease protein